MMMENGGDDVAPDEMRRAVKQAILLNEHLLRRAWGVLFLALSLSMFLSIFGTPIIDSLESSRSRKHPASQCDRERLRRNCHPLGIQTSPKHR